METEILVPQQEQTTDETTPTLRPWTTPRLQRLSGQDAAKVLWVSESPLPPSSGPS